MRLPLYFLCGDHYLKEQGFFCPTEYSQPVTLPEPVKAGFIVQRFGLNRSKRLAYAVHAAGGTGK